MGKKRRVPEVLWRLFRNRARSLAHTIMSLINQSPPSKCRCNSCLVCVSTENDMSFLIQPDDPSDYRNLLHQCFVVVNDNAPPLSNLSLDNRWPQLQIAQRTIEMIMTEQPVSSNTICSGYDKGKRSSLIVELLTDSSWGLLLKRVGDDVMIYLLKYSSIFLPLPYKKHHQVAGPPINDLCLKSSKLAAKSNFQHPPSVQLGTQKKRKRVDDVSLILERQPANSSVSYCDNSSSIGCAGSIGRTYLKPFSKHPRCNHGLLNFSFVATLTDIISSRNEEDSDKKLQQSSNQVTGKSRKRSRPFSWQRNKSHRKSNFEESNNETPCVTMCPDEDRLCGKLQCVFNNRMQENCFCCFLLQAPKLVTERDHIDRLSMFYSLEWSSTVLPRKRIF